MSKNIRESVLSGFAEGPDRSNAAAALDAAAGLLREVPSQSFWNAADELRGIVRDKAGDPLAVSGVRSLPAVGDNGVEKFSCRTYAVAAVSRLGVEGKKVDCKTQCWNDLGLKGNFNIVHWSLVDGVDTYRVYLKGASGYAYLGTSGGHFFLDDNIVPRDEVSA